MKLFEMFDQPGRETAPASEAGEGQFGVYAKGGSIGGNKSKEPIKTFTDKKEAQDYARRMRNALTPGERKHYKMSYVTKPITETSPQQQAMEKNRGEDALRAELSQAQIDGHPEHVERLKAELDSLNEAGEEGTPAVSSEDVTSAWKAVFPNSSVQAGRAFGGGTAFKFRLAKDNTEVASGIMENDPLNYSAILDTDGSWKEWSTSMFIAPPEGSHLAYGSAKFRKKSAKNVTLAQIQKRFAQVKDFVSTNADNLKDPKFDIKSKLGESVTEDGEDKTWNTLKGQTGYDVTVRHNFYGGKYYEIGYRPFRVLAGSPEEAKQFVINNLELVEKYFRNLRLRRGQGSIPAIRKSESYHAKPSDVTKVTPTGLRTGKIFNTDGKQIQFNSDDYPAAESVNEAEHSEEMQTVLFRLQQAGGSVYNKATLVKGNETAILAQNGDVRFAIYPDGKFDRAKAFIDFQRDGWELEMNLG